MCARESKIERTCIGLTAAGLLCGLGCHGLLPLGCSAAAAAVNAATGRRNIASLPYCRHRRYRAHCRRRCLRALCLIFLVVV